MSGVVVTVRMKLKPEFIESFPANLNKSLVETRKRKGFRNIRADFSASEPGKVLLIEEWDSAEDYQAYLKFRMDTGNIGGFTTEAPEIEIWDKQIA